MINVANYSVLVSLFNLMNSSTVLHELIKSSNFLRNNIISFGILLSKKSIDIFNKLHRYDLMRELVIIFVEVPSKLKIKD